MRLKLTILKIWDFDTSPSQYYDFSFQKIKEKFINYNCSYFEHMYFSFLPILAIPVYQQMASNDYIYGKSYNFKYNDYITEMLANKIGTLGYLFLLMQRREVM